MKFKEFYQRIFSIKNKIINTKKYKVVTILNIRFKFRNFSKTKNCVAIIGAGGIGDYMFVRPYFKFFKLSPKFKNCKLIYFAKDVYADFVRAYDSEYFEEIIPYEEDLRNSLDLAEKYQFKYLINLHYITLGYSTEWLVRQNLAEKVKAEEKITDIINPDNFPSSINKDLKIYNKICAVLEGGISELERRRRFFEEVLEIKIPEQNKKLAPLFSLDDKFILISINAGARARRYDTEKWKTIIDFILTHTPEDLSILFLGNIYEYDKINELINKFDKEFKDRLINIAGILPISMLPVILKKAKFLLSVETGTVHIAESVGCNTLCLCCGAYYKRFQPIGETVKYIYPDEFEKLIEENNEKELAKFNNINWTYKTNDISPNKVINVLKDYLEPTQNMPQTLAAVERERESNLPS
jgi:ADP-heptose:LPS heptosyltransferase